MNRINDRIYLLLGILPPCILGIITGIGNRSRIAHIVRTIHRPPFAMHTFWMVMFWLALYVLVGYAISLVLRSRIYYEEKMNALLITAAQFIMNTIFVYVFFNLHMWFLGFLIYLVYLALIALNIVLFYRINTILGAMLVPYFIFAFYTCFLTIVTIFYN